ncbi:von Willebrand factor A domain-containing protein 5A-like isoform X2 [Portunus trituberculatus]|uniref:von Willebrand factor A domain-containing protein 5A-like isoform X2 n=1 Tax=Portunus trituberculatus TaxID=210409 RepID=UPI001E1D1A89|nr:von Willebrand factor A domain-containing protein 5A-like isoform X2 [Portunus trituberculatus]XP_045123553.1 von Willebrand factor A domain-containing protein 5A-like isoform X2 [Portunus trituberculatus]
MTSVCELPPHLARFGLLGILKDHNDWRVVSLESVSAEVTIRGFVAQVTANMVYHNHAGHALQVRAVLPMEEGAAVYHCEARLDGRTIVTHCMEKKKAEKVYKEAVKKGNTAILAREDPDSSDILSLNLGNFPAGTRAEVTLRLVMELKVETDGAIGFVLPAVLNPRYIPADHPRRNNWNLVWEEREVFMPQPYSMEVKAQVCGSHQIARVVSHTDPLNVSLADDALSAQVSQDGGFTCDHDWSLLVYYKNAYQPHLLRETGERSATGIMRDDLLMLNLFPEMPAQSYSNRNEIVFVVDRSGSMNGENIQSARATLLLFLKSLPAGCLFNIVSFGSSFSSLFPKGSRVYSEKTLREACQLQATMDADMGGTEILAPLKDIYNKPPTPGYSRQILLITDGMVANVEQVLQLVGRHAHETRLFAVGIGHGASSALVCGAARAGRGRSEMVIKQGLLQQKVMGLVGSMVQESVQGVTVSCEVEPACRVTLVPKVPPVIFGGQHLILYARVPPATQVKKITVRGQLGASAVLNTMEGEHFTVVHDEAKALHRLAARSQILQWQLDEEEGVAKDMVALSVASGVVCRRTALVGVDQESGKPMPESPLIKTGEELNAPFLRSGVRNLFSKSLMPVTLSSCAVASAPQLLSAARVQRFGRSSCAVASPQLRLEALSAARVQTFGGSLPNSSAPPPPFEESFVHSEATADPQPPSGLMAVVSLQQFDGSWGLKDAAHLTTVPLDILSAANPTKSEAAWATALVLVLLERKFGEQKEEWELLATKAVSSWPGVGSSPTNCWPRLNSRWTPSDSPCGGGSSGGEQSY